MRTVRADRKNCILRLQKEHIPSIFFTFGILQTKFRHPLMVWDIFKSSIISIGVDNVLVPFGIYFTTYWMNFLANKNVLNNVALKTGNNFHDGSFHGFDTFWVSSNSNFILKNIYNIVVLFTFCLYGPIFAVEKINPIQLFLRKWSLFLNIKLFVILTAKYEIYTGLHF